MTTARWVGLLVVLGFALIFFLESPMLALASLPDSGPYVIPIPIEKMRPNGEFQLHVAQGDYWQEVGSLSFDKYFRERELDLAPYLKGDGEHRIALMQEGGGAAQIDSVFIGGMPLVTNLGAAVEGKLLRRDFDVIDATGRKLEFLVPSRMKNKTLSLTARIEGEKIPLFPFQFPRINTFKEVDHNAAFYFYRLGTETNDESEVGAPLFREFCRSGTGHPSAFTYGYVWNDDEALYVKIDFAPDNTMDGLKDYAEMYVNTGTEIKRFRVSSGETRWGRPDFTYTEKVEWQHKVYDFRIPLTELGSPAGLIALAFAAYGTAAPGSGACCFADGSCSDGSQSGCAAAGGKYLGDETDCTTANCPPPTGACCDPDGTCVEAVVEEECVANGADYQGHGTLCADVECPIPTGACCDPSTGICVDAVETQNCLPPLSFHEDTLCHEVGCGEPPTATPTHTPTQTPTATATATPTTTPVPEGGSCTDISQCESDLFCVEQVCTDVVAPAPAASNTALVIALSLLAAIGGFAILRRRNLRHYLWSM